MKVPSSVVSASTDLLGSGALGSDPQRSSPSVSAKQIVVDSLGISEKIVAFARKEKFHEVGGL